MYGLSESIKAGVVNSGRGPGFGTLLPLQLIAQLGPALIVDVGAAFGHTVRVSLDANPAARVIAYEPFEGNLALLRAAAQDDPRLTVRPVAVTDRAGTARFDVPWVVDAARAAQGFPRGSSVAGKIARNGSLHVETVRLDQDIAEHVDFLKLDVQGGELAALEGAEALMAGAGIDYIYIEFNGNWRVLRFLARHGYVLFDSVYLAWPHRWLKWPVPAWPPGTPRPLSTGVTAKRVWPPMPFRGLMLYCLWFALLRGFVCGLQTDLICVHESKRAQFALLIRDMQLAASARRQAKAETAKGDTC
ncbi:MAG TPA: FkbM family methyltransferase [Rhizomicrobium sp.]|jgi:FkbM family methyltransferase|nr:FkbM family methyltransferase [Rhizomicrobium sp.]